MIGSLLRTFFKHKVEHITMFCCVCIFFSTSRLSSFFKNSFKLWSTQKLVKKWVNNLRLVYSEDLSIEMGESPINKGMHPLVEALVTIF